MSQLQVGGIVLGVTLGAMLILYKLTEAKDYMADARTNDEQRSDNQRLAGIRERERSGSFDFGGTRRKRGVKRTKRR
jgi:hypothetical protein